MIGKFYDRCDELKFLKDKFENLKRGEFGVLYGRRRIGKSELLRKFISKVKEKKIYINVIGAIKSFNNAIISSFFILFLLLFIF